MTHNLRFRKLYVAPASDFRSSLQNCPAWLAQRERAPVRTPRALALTQLSSRLSLSIKDALSTIRVSPFFQGDRYATSSTGVFHD